MIEIRVELGERSYPICVGPGLLADVGRLCRQAGLAGRALVVSDTRVGPLYGPAVEASLDDAGFRAARLDLPDGEVHKDLDSVRRIYEAALAARLDRGSFLVALGGGVVGDVAGFAAATFLRGVGFVQAPTTLLAQVDASVGGKVGVNLPQGKNLVGAFYQPRLVVADVGTLRTLPDRELVAGLAEVIKHGLIADAALFAFVEDNLDRLLAREPEALGHVIERSCRIKSQVVAADEREAGPRALLNLGHTVGHALEAAAGYGRYLHGEAVAVGMVTAALLSLRLGWLERESVERIARLLAACGLPTAAVDVDRDRLLDGLRLDKKAVDGRARFVLLTRIGQAALTDRVPPAWVRDALDEQAAWAQSPAGMG